MLLCGALAGRTLSEAVAVMPVFPQVRENLRVSRREVPPAVLEEAARLNEQLAGAGRVLVRPSGTEPVIRVLAEAETEAEARNLCGRLAELVRLESG
jgi:phosphoglucosamine mutase